MPARLKLDKRRRSTQITPEAVALFRKGYDLLNCGADSYGLRDVKIRLAAALSRSKFRPSPLDREPRSLMGCDNEQPAVVVALQEQLLKAIGERALPK